MNYQTRLTVLTQVSTSVSQYDAQKWPLLLHDHSGQLQKVVLFGKNIVNSFKLHSESNSNKNKKLDSTKK